MICAPITETNTSVSHADGMVMSHAIKADVSIELNEAKLSADDRIVENIKEFKTGKLSLNGDHLEYKVLGLILGHKVEKLPDGGETLIAKGDDDGKYVGIGFYATSIKNSVKKFRAIWFQKIKFGIPNESLETKGDDGIKFQTPTIEGTVLTDIFGVWKQEGYFETEAKAVAWLNTKAGISNTDPEPDPDDDDDGDDNP